MTEFFIVANSFAAPFVSDQSIGFASGDSPASALESFAQTYRHPAGLYAAAVYRSAEAYHKGEKQLAYWLCNHELEKRRLTSGLHSYSYLSHGAGSFEIDGQTYTCDDPRNGSVTP